MRPVGFTSRPELSVTTTASCCARRTALAAAHSMAARGQRFDLIFLDPPYQQDFLSRALPLCGALLKEGGLVYAESGLPLTFDEADGDARPDAARPDAARPDWMAPWQVIRADKAGTVYYHLLQYNKAPAAA